MINFKELPFYIQFTFKLLMILCLGVMVTYAQNLFIPLAFSILLSILLLPVTNFLENKGHLPKSAANFIAIIFALSVIGGLIYFLSHQVASFLDDIPSIRSHLENHYATIQKWIQQRFNITPRQQTTLIENVTAETSGTAVIGQTFFTITQTIFYTIMVAIYSFLILHYRHLIKRFLMAVFNQAHEPEVSAVLQESKSIVQKYMLGLVTEMGIVACANSFVLLLIGIKYAVFLGIFSAILNIIPYVGIIIGILFTCLVTLTTSTHLSDIIWVVISYEIIHFIDSNFLMPRIVGSKVKINALITIIGVVIGGTLVGLPGIFLALPTIAILKIIFDRIDAMKPWGMLMGDDTEPEHRSILYRKLERTFRKKKKHITTVTDTPSDTI